MLIDLINKHLDKDGAPNVKDYEDLNKYNKDTADYFARKAKAREDLKKQQEENQPKPEIPFPKIPIGTSRAEVERLMEEYNSQVLAQSGIDLNEKVSEGISHDNLNNLREDIGLPPEEAVKDIKPEENNPTMKNKCKITKNRIILIGIISLVCISLGIIYTFSESKEDRQLRISNDRNIYVTIDPEVIHLDVKCKRIHKQKGYNVIPKSRYTGQETEDSFCPECCTLEDITILNNQIRP